MLIVLLIALILLLSWIKNSMFTNLSLMPSWLGVWCDEFPRFRTAIPFFFLSILVISVERKFLKYLVINCALVIFVELTQLLIPTRHCDVYDMLWGCGGVIVGLLLGHLLQVFYIFNSKQTHN
ncbi:VanZ family protein [Flectobacillus roseus]|uniref:VanZ family protein n=1 Tax=Flectobacillus roseus TaxID=502259 RepID=A0ABT6YF32_9BACT|nr:VanZ family protein [Flectobacillus roseus]MDI9862199.1 VanZ family protein [Flectobacillus roseus]